MPEHRQARGKWGFTSRRLKYQVGAETSKISLKQYFRSILNFGVWCTHCCYMTLVCVIIYFAVLLVYQSHQNNKSVYGCDEPFINLKPYNVFFH